MTKSKIETQVGIIWCDRAPDEGEDPTISTLGGGHGVRSYPRDEYDPRVDIGRDREKDGPIPFFENSAEAIVWSTLHPKECCQVPIHKVRGAFA